MVYVLLNVQSRELFYLVFQDAVKADDKAASLGPDWVVIERDLDPLDVPVVAADPAPVADPAPAPADPAPAA